MTEIDTAYLSIICRKFPTNENNTQNTAELSPYKLYQSSYEKKLFDAPHGSYTRAKLNPNSLYNLYPIVANCKNHVHLIEFMENNSKKITKIVIGYSAKWHLKIIRYIYLTIFKRSVTVCCYCYIFS